MGIWKIIAIFVIINYCAGNNIDEIRPNGSRGQHPETVWYFYMKEIKLTQGQVALVDDEDYEYLNQWKWYAQKSRGTFYACRYTKNEVLIMHRIILNTPFNMEVDHRDHNGLNNQRHNIRNCTRSQNHMNKDPRGSSKYLGVSWDKSRNKWRAFIQTRQISNGKRKTLFNGQYNTEEEAAIAYNEAAKRLHGEFANLNIIEY